MDIDNRWVFESIIKDLMDYSDFNSNTGTKKVRKQGYLVYLSENEKKRFDEEFGADCYGAITRLSDYRREVPPQEKVDNDFIELGDIGNIKITKLPKGIDPDGVLREKIKEAYGSRCPYCHSVNIEETTVLTSKYLYKRLGEPWEFWKPLTKGGTLEFKCRHCGMEWESPWFPVDLGKLALKEAQKTK